MAHSTSITRRRISRAAGLTLASFLAAAAPAAAAPGQIVNDGAKGAITGSYIVVLTPAAATQADTVIAKLGRDHFVNGRFKYRNSIVGFAGTTSRTEALELAADPNVAYVEQDRTIGAFGSQANPPSWGLDRIDQRNLPLNHNYTAPSGGGAGVTAYVIDSGIRTTHQDFGGRATWGINTTGDGQDTDCNGHGTHVAGTLGGTQYGVAKKVSLVAVKVLGCTGGGAISSVIAGVDWVNTQHQPGQPAVANVSLGGSRSTALDAAVNSSIADGVTYAVAAGNAGGDACDTSPARVTDAITVSATTSADALAPFSNTGMCTDIFAPGENIVSTWRTSDTATFTLSGTSMASPHVAGAAALLLGVLPTATPATIADMLKSSAVADKVTGIGSLTPNRLLIMNNVQTAPPVCATKSSTRAVTILDAYTVDSLIAMPACDRNASATTKVTVAIVHPRPSDLTVDLVAPDGTVKNLLSRTGTTADINQTFTVDMSAVPASGSWKLRVRDAVSGATGKIVSWTLTP